MRAIVLVGGQGTRLRPLTFTRPKAMLPIVHRPMIEHIVAHLAHYGVDDVVLSLGYRPDAFIEAYPDGRCAGIPLHYAVEPVALDTGGAIRFAALDAGIDERFLVVNGDVLTDLDIGRFVAFHDTRGAEGSISLHGVDDPSRYGVVPTGPDGRVQAFVEKPPRDAAPTNLINAGIYVLEPSVIDRIDDGRPVSVERETFPAMTDAGSLYALDGETYWIDTGKPYEYVQAQLDLIDGVRGPGAQGVVPGAKIDADAAVERSVIGAGAVVEAGATVTASVLLPGARVATGAVVERSVVGEGAEVAADARITDHSVIGDHAVVERAARLHGARRPEAPGKPEVGK